MAPRRPPGFSAKNRPIYEAGGPKNGPENRSMGGHSPNFENIAPIFKKPRIRTIPPPSPIGGGHFRPFPLTTGPFFRHAPAFVQTAVFGPAALITRSISLIRQISRFFGRFWGFGKIGIFEKSRVAETRFSQKSRFGHTRFSKNPDFLKIPKFFKKSGNLSN